MELQENKIYFLGGMLSDSLIEECIKNSISYDMAADHFQKKFVKGLPKNATFINVPFIRYSHLRKKNNITIYKETNKRVKSYFNYNYINIILKYYTLKKIVKDFDFNNSVIFCYSIHTPFLKLIKFLKKKYDFKVVQIVPDLPQYMNLQNNVTYLYKALKKIDIYKIDKLLKYIDIFVPFTKTMYTDYLYKYDKPYYVMEGIFEEKKVTSINKKNREKLIVVYAGSLTKQYGVEKLINIFKHLHNENVELLLCGSGELTNILKDSLFPNIKYLGLLNTKDTNNLIQNADLLINPREPEGEYTKYSFPSKIFEYLSSGNKVLCFKLPGIPDDYDKYLYFFDSNDEADMRRRIIDVLNFEENKINNIMFLKEKTAEKHVFKILQILQNL